MPFMVRLTFAYLSHPFVKSGITISPTLKNLKKLISNFNSNKAFGNLFIDGKVELLNETLLNIFGNYIPNPK